MDLRYQEYAKLLVEIGVNVQPGQELVLACPVECAWFGRLCAQAAYDAGAREVILNWRDDALTRMRYLYAADEVFDSLPQWQQTMLNGYAQAGAAYLSISASDPENLKGADKMIMNLAQKMIKGKRESEITENDKIMISYMENGCNLIDRQRIRPIVEEMTKEKR